jgi:hypothetical protein
VPDTELTGLPALTTLADGDLLPALDVSDTSQDPAGSNKKITAANVAVYMAAELGIATITADIDAVEADVGTLETTVATLDSNVAADIAALDTRVDALEAATPTVNAQTGTTYTLVLADAGAIVTLANAAAITLTVPEAASVAFPVGTRIDLIQVGAGQVTVAGSGAATVSKTAADTLKLRAEFSAASLIHYATDEWVLVGDLEAAP